MFCLKLLRCESVTSQQKDLTGQYKDLTSRHYHLTSLADLYHNRINQTSWILNVPLLVSLNERFTDPRSHYILCIISARFLVSKKIRRYKKLRGVVVLIKNNWIRVIKYIYLYDRQYCMKNISKKKKPKSFHSLHFLRRKPWWKTHRRRDCSFFLTEYIVWDLILCDI